jgi:hypothetical protein
MELSKVVIRLWFFGKGPAVVAQMAIAGRNAKLALTLRLDLRLPFFARKTAADL